MHYGLVSASEVSVLKENRKMKETRIVREEIDIVVFELLPQNIQIDRLHCNTFAEGVREKMWR